MITEAELLGNSQAKAEERMRLIGLCQAPVYDSHDLMDKVGVLSDEAAASLLHLHGFSFIFYSRRHYFWSDCPDLGGGHISEHFKMKELDESAKKVSYEQALDWVKRANEQFKKWARIKTNAELIAILPTMQKRASKL